jgi:hypothetical protein
MAAHSIAELLTDHVAVAVAVHDDVYDHEIAAVSNRSAF